MFFCLERVHCGKSPRHMNFTPNNAREGFSYFFLHKRSNRPPLKEELVSYVDYHGDFCLSQVREAS